MAGKTLDEYFVSLGIKGQNVVLKNIKNIKKEANALSKLKPVLKFGKSVGSILAGIAGKVSIPKKNMPAPQPVPGQPVPGQPEPEETKKNNKKFNESVKTFAGGSKNFALGVAHFDPVRAVQQAVTSSGAALGAVVAAIPGVGGYIKDLPKGLAEVSNAIVGMAAGAVDIAKNSASAQYGLTNRNETLKYYGGEFGRSNLSNAQFSELVMTIAGSYGKIQKPMQGILDELVKTKNTEALSRVASGNWASTGTDKGWFLQQIANETAGLPPSVAQSFQNSLLRNNADLIQDKGKESGSQRTNAAFINQSENQIAAKYNATAANFDSIYSLSKQFNSIEVSMVKSGASFASEVDKAARAIAKLPEIISEVNRALSHAPSAVRRQLEK